MRTSMAWTVAAAIGCFACVSEPNIELNSPCDSTEPESEPSFGPRDGCDATDGPPIPDAQPARDSDARFDSGPTREADAGPDGGDVADGAPADATDRRDGAVTRDAAADHDAAPPTVGAGFVAFEGGTFSMGSPEDELDRRDDESPHLVTIDHRFWLKRTEVTRGEWRMLMGTEPSVTACAGDGCPVEKVSWYDGAAWANALSQAEGLQPCYRLAQCSGQPGGGDGFTCLEAAAVGIECTGFRLPTEAEWEYAARAGGRTGPFPWGAQPASCARAVMDEGLGEGCGTGDPQPVCSRPAGNTAGDPDGLCDMAGNVWEWVEDWYGPYTEAPVDGSAREEIGDEGRVRRGGGYSSGANNLRTARRSAYPPEQRWPFVGFRVARTVP